MKVAQPTAGDRIKAAIGVAALHGLLAYALIVGLTVRAPRLASDDLKTFAVPPSPPAAAEKTRAHPRSSRKPEGAAAPPNSRKPEGAAAPPNLKAKATQITLPPPIIHLAMPLPVVAAPKPAAADDPWSGASDVPGVGTGSGGLGNGTGSGGAGEGEGDGGDVPPRRIGGRIRDSDYPRGAVDAGAGGTVSVRYTVDIDGRARGCVVTRSSGSAELDQATCRLIEQRFRYEPSRDARGRAVRSEIVENHSWVMDREMRQ